MIVLRMNLLSFRLRPAMGTKLSKVVSLTTALVPCLCFLSVFSAAQVVVGKAPRAEVNLNGTWGYILNQPQSPIPSSGWINTRIPALPLTDGTVSVWYQRNLTVPLTWNTAGRSFFLKLEKAGHYAAIYVNGSLLGEHFGQFSSFEFDVTSAIIPGQPNLIQIYVHKADTTYVRPGLNLNQSSCPPENPDCMGNAYRASAPVVSERNWVGLVGDITFSWRPTENVSDVFVVSSVRNLTLTANLQINGASPSATVQATVLDGSTPVLSLPPQPVVAGAATLEAPWANPVFWGPAPYGQPKLYTLQTQLLESGQVVDTIYTQFGFREIWQVGTTLYLNNQKLYMAGNFCEKLAPIRYMNDRRPQAFMLWVLEQSGMNMIESHWDDAGEPLLQLADEMGVLVVAAFYCDGRPAGQSQVDSVSGWTDWMVSTAQEWTQARRNHPSIIIWRPTDVFPTGVAEASIYPQIAKAVRDEDPSGRPVADGSDVDTFVQNIQDAYGTECDHGLALESQLARETKPLFTREIYGNFNLPCEASMLKSYYNVSWTDNSAGILQGIMPIYVHTSITPTWFSISGIGNRPTDPQLTTNWMKRNYQLTTYGTQFTNLYKQYVQPALLNTSPTSGDFQAPSLPASGVETVFLQSSTDVANPYGVTVADDGSGTAWFVVPLTGAYQMIYTLNGIDISQNVTVMAPNPF